MKTALSDLERLQKAGRLLAMSIEALQNHMQLIKDQATKNSAKGDQYWAVYSQGVAVIMQARLFIEEDMRQMTGARNDH